MEQYIEIERRLLREIKNAYHAVNDTVPNSTLLKNQTTQMFAQLARLTDGMIETAKKNFSISDIVRSELTKDS